MCVCVLHCPAAGLPLALPGQALSFLTLAVHAHHPAVPSQLVGEGGSGIRTTKGSNYELILLEFGKKGAPPASDYSVRDPRLAGYSTQIKQVQIKIVHWFSIRAYGSR